MEGLIILAILVGIGYFYGTRIEQQHFQSLQHRERQVQTLPTSCVGAKTPIPQAQAAELFVGSVVISSDYFKTFVASFMNLLGGRITVYETLLEQGRREAVLRLQEQALAWGAKHLINVRIETAELGSNSGQGIIAVEVMAYGTGIK